MFERRYEYKIVMTSDFADSFECLIIEKCKSAALKKALSKCPFADIASIRCSIETILD